MTITISQSDYCDLFTEIERTSHVGEVDSPTVSSSNSLTVNYFDLTDAYPSQLGQGYSRLIQLRPGLEINIEQYQLHDRLIMTQCDRLHSLEMGFLLSGQNREWRWFDRCRTNYILR